MLPGNMQYWQPCKRVFNGQERIGSKDIQIDEPIHFFGPTPGAQSEEEKKESMTSLYAQPPVTDQDDP